ncbi:hypothetical protein ACFSMW_12220 [Virgibacillus halophilus]|uniref:hypothetical protein n=1 Tax=Tigheibacillus halophilus TaxID=361280 RepID=UPI003628F053
MIRYRMIKEKNGAGVIPVLVAAIPWLLFLFSKQLQEFLFQEGSLWWLLFCILYLVLLVGGVMLHFREKAWAAFHIAMIQDILEERKNFK